MSHTGTVARFRGDKGFGFITSSDGTEVFLHAQACGDGMVPVQGDFVTFDLENSTLKPGQKQAANVSGCTGKPGETGKGGPPGILSGTVKTFNAEKGFGFITGADGVDTFCHLNAVVDGTTPQPGDTLSYDVEDSKSKPGQHTCCNVRGGTGYPVPKGKGKGKDSGKDSWGAAKGGGKDSWGASPYGGGKGGGWGGDSWGGGKDAGWGGDSWGGGKGGGDSWGKGGGDSWGKGGGGDSWGKGGGGKGDSWGGKGDSWGGGKGDSWGGKGGGKDDWGKGGGGGGDSWGKGGGGKGKW